MARYVVERTFSAGLHIPQSAEGANVCRTVVQNNAEDGVTWVHSYITTDRKRSYCIYDGPNPEAIRHAAGRNKQPITQITEVSVLDPYFYRDAS